MSVAIGDALLEQDEERSALIGAAGSFRGYVGRNRALLVGFLLLFALLLFVVIGHLTVDTAQADPLSVRPLRPPSRALPFGSDKQGRNLYAVMVVGTPLTFRIGLVAGFLGVTFGTLVAFVSAYYGGIVDDVIK